MKSFNLLTENWIPVQQQGQFETISLKRLLCRDEDWQICMSRDDMELAALQLIVCIVQVMFMPDDEDCLMDAYKKPMSEADYDKGILPFMEWFDVLHPEYPFMQTASVKPDIKNKKVENGSSIQKLFVGLPEESSKSGSSNAFFNSSDEIECVCLGESVIALFQQATNGFSLGGQFYSVGLKGSMPITTLIQERNLRKCVWCNVLNKEFIKRTSSLLDGDKNNQPTWVVSPSFDSKSPEYAHTIGLLRGLFWQPARVKLDVDDTFKVKGFFKEQGMSYVKDFWHHPHTPIDIIRLKNNKESPFLSAKQDLPLWGQMLSFFYTQSPEKEGISRALVVSHYAQTIGRKKPINLVVGGYVKGKSTESLAGRKHEMYSISSGWENQIAEMSLLVSYGLDAQKALDDAVYSFGKELKEIRIVRNKEKPSKLITNLKNQAKKLYFNNSEELFHSIMRELDVNDISKYNDNFVQLAIGTFDTIFLPYEHDPKLLKAIVTGRRGLIKKLVKIR
ncbi:type I-E CRISPR-associated protein Cse1/CasA [Methanosarcina barkeri]|uniref:Cascade antiviral complex protein n=1 Tax=Methanosarcina barkeri 227 TaxID=1434106 RepID=A0A0E3R1S2_METBA|nr:type I-E CRISPR-associated protein Cse1/CasA [Methanosarcina barkeri]AKB58139.1 Cascade antiviral complex protein [Methanosarcina barkeri 227]